MSGKCLVRGFHFSQKFERKNFVRKKFTCQFITWIIFYGYLRYLIVTKARDTRLGWGGKSVVNVFDFVLFDRYSLKGIFFFCRKLQKKSIKV